MEESNLSKHLKILFLLPLVTVSLGVSAQSENSIGFDKVPAEKMEGWIKVTGRVLNIETKEPIENVVLHVDGRDNASRTDRYGKFLLLAKKGDVIDVFHNAMRRQYFIAKDETPKDILLRYEYIELENLLVVGKASSSPKKEKVSSKDMEKAPWKEADPLEGYFAEYVDMPEFQGGMAECMKFLANNLNYPEAALQNRNKGRVLVGFTIETDGTITDIETIEGICPELDEEAMRVVGLMPKWRPCCWYGKKIAMKFSLPVEFRLKK